MIRFRLSSEPPGTGRYTRERDTTLGKHITTPVPMVSQSEIQSLLRPAFSEG